MVYVLGTGRCGSTVLDILLGSHPDVCSTGELRQLPIVARGLRQPCSCGEDALSCPFWTKVLAELEPAVPLAELDQGRRFEFTRALPRTALLLAFPRSAVSRYARSLAALLRAISVQSGRPVVVDSSKHIGRAMILWKARGRGIDLRFVHLVRDGRGFVWSKRRVLDGQGLGLSPQEKNVADLSVWWVVSNLLSSVLFRLHPGRYLRVRYEDLVAKPERTLEGLGRFLGLDLTDVIATVRDHRPVPVGHVVGGNRLRFARGLVLKPDTEWQQNLPQDDERTFWGIAGWLARRYGYEARQHRLPAVEPGLPSRTS